MQSGSHIFYIVSLAGLAIFAKSAIADVFYPIEFYGTVTTPSCTVELVEATQKRSHTLQVRDCSLWVGDSILSELYVSYGSESLHPTSRYLYNKTVPIEASFTPHLGSYVVYGNGFDREKLQRSYGLEFQQNFVFPKINRIIPFEALNIEFKYK